MSTQSRINLKANSETGDIITQDLLDSIIDSSLNLVDVTAQTISSNIIVPNVACNVVSADSAYITNLFAAGLNTNQNPFIELYADVTSNQITGAGFTRIDVPTSVASGNSNLFTQTSGKVTYTGSVTARFGIHYELSFKQNIDTQTETTDFQIYKNNAAIPASLVTLDTDINRKAIHVQAITKLNPSDEFELQIACKTTTADTYEIHNLNCHAFPLYWGS